MTTTVSASMTNTPITTSTELGGGGGNWICHGIKSDNKVFLHFIGISGGVIAGIVISVVVLSILIVVAVIISVICLLYNKKGMHDHFVLVLYMFHR